MPSQKAPAKMANQLNRDLRKTCMKKTVIRPALSAAIASPSGVCQACSDAYDRPTVAAVNRTRPTNTSVYVHGDEFDLLIRRLQPSREAATRTPRSRRRSDNTDSQPRWTWN